MYLKSLTIHWKFWFDFSTISILTSERCRCDKLSNHFALLVVLITLMQQVWTITTVPMAEVFLNNWSWEMRLVGRCLWQRYVKHSLHWYIISNCEQPTFWTSALQQHQRKTVLTVRHFKQESTCLDSFLGKKKSSLCFFRWKKSHRVVLCLGELLVNIHKSTALLFQLNRYNYPSQWHS